MREHYQKLYDEVEDYLAHTEAKADTAKVKKWDVVDNKAHIEALKLKFDLLDRLGQYKT